MPPKLALQSRFLAVIARLRRPIPPLDQGFSRAGSEELAGFSGHVVQRNFDVLVTDRDPKGSTVAQDPAQLEAHAGLPLKYESVVEFVSPANGGNIDGNSGVAPGYRQTNRAAYVVRGVFRLVKEDDDDLSRFPFAVEIELNSIAVRNSIDEPRTVFRDLAYPFVFVGRERPRNRNYCEQEEQYRGETLHEIPNGQPLSGIKANIVAQSTAIGIFS
jgi:hypothetical protein